MSSHQDTGNPENGNVSDTLIAWQACGAPAGCSQGGKWHPIPLQALPGDAPQAQERSTSPCKAQGYPASYLNRGRYYLHKAGRACPTNELKCCDLHSRGKKQRALQDGRGKRQGGPLPALSGLISWLRPWQWPLCRFGTCSAESSFYGTSMLTAPPGRNQGSIYFWPSLRSLQQLL